MSSITYSLPHYRITAFFCTCTPTRIHSQSLSRTCTFLPNLSRTYHDTLTVSHSPTPTPPSLPTHAATPSPLTNRTSRSAMHRTTTHPPHLSTTHTALQTPPPHTSRQQATQGHSRPHCTACHLPHATVHQTTVHDTTVLFRTTLHCDLARISCKQVSIRKSLCCLWVLVCVS